MFQQGAGRFLSAGSGWECKARRQGKGVGKVGRRWFLFGWLLCGTVALSSCRAATPVVEREAGATAPTGLGAVATHRAPTGMPPGTAVALVRTRIAEGARATAEISQTTAVPAAAETAQSSPTLEPGARRFVIRPESATARYEVEEEFFAGAAQIGRGLGLGRAVGETTQVIGEFTLRTEPRTVLESGRFEVDLRTLNSDEPRRDEEIRERWLESNRYPKAIFVAQEVEGLPATVSEGAKVEFRLKGELSIRGVSRPVTFEGTATWTQDTISGEAATKLRLTDFGVAPPSIAGMLKVADEVTVRVQFVAREVR